MSDQVSASHILLMYEGSMRSSATRSKEEAQRRITELKEKLDAGEDFGGLAKAHSDCPSAEKGGSLGSFGRGQMVPEFEEVAFSLEVGASSGVIETPFGFHLIHRTG